MGTSFRCADTRRSLRRDDMVIDEGRSSGESDTFPNERRRSPRLLNNIMEAAPDKLPLKSANNQLPKKRTTNNNNNSVQKNPPKSKNNQLPKKRTKNHSVQPNKRSKIPVVDVHSPDCIHLDVKTMDPALTERLTHLATLALKDHAIQLNYGIELRVLELEKASYNEAAPDLFMISFKACSEIRGTRTYEAHVFDGMYETQVTKVRMMRMIGGRNVGKWYTGIVGLPKI